MANNIKLPKTEKHDLEAFFQFQLNKEANHMAAFTAKDPNDKAAFKNGTCHAHIYGHVAFDNYGSQKVLEKYRFVTTETDREYANARQAKIEEYIYTLSE